MYEIDYSREALKALRAMPRNVSALIREKLAYLSENPHEAQNVKKLIGRPGYRLRVGDWRIIYELDERPKERPPVLTILVLTIAPRGGVYQ
jgi:mRNA interferase RelE/StbE